MPVQSCSARRTWTNSRGVRPTRPAISTQSSILGDRKVQTAILCRGAPLAVLLRPSLPVFALRLQEPIPAAQSANLLLSLAQSALSRPTVLVRAGGLSHLHPRSI